MRGHRRPENAEANARRIAASWNACLDVPTVVLEAQQSGGLPGNERLGTAKKLLEEVVNLCAIGDIDENTDDGLGWGGFVRDAKAFINQAAAQGQQSEGDGA